MNNASLTWWQFAKYGMFVHWGLYSILAGKWKDQETADVGEWIMRHLNIPVSSYRKLAAEFNPALFDADEWVLLAKRAGMKYLVFTAKHHDGFAMYHSKVSPYNIVDATPYGRDPVALLSDSCRKHGIKFCLYYSQAQDWDDPNGFGYGSPDNLKDFSTYFKQKCLPQVRELLTNYGELGLIWFDTPAEMTREQSLELFNLVKSVQPDCIVSGRIGNQIGEYISTSDNCIPTLPYERDWEVPATLNNTWGFKSNDKNWKSVPQVLELLIRINSRGGNYLLNVGPDAQGVIPRESIQILEETGEYIRKNEASIYGTQCTPVYPYDFRWCTFTSKPYHLYVHVMDNRELVYLPCFGTTVIDASILSSGERLDFSQSTPREGRIGSIKISLPKVSECQGARGWRVIDLKLAEPQISFDSLHLL